MRRQPAFMAGRQQQIGPNQRAQELIKAHTVTRQPERHVAGGGRTYPHGSGADVRRDVRHEDRTQSSRPVCATATRSRPQTPARPAKTRQRVRKQDSRNAASAPAAREEAACRCVRPGDYQSTTANRKQAQSNRCSVSGAGGGIHILPPTPSMGGPVMEGIKQRALSRDEPLQRTDQPAPGQFAGPRGGRRRSLIAGPSSRARARQRCAATTPPP